jgi:hypothetical protein
MEERKRSNRQQRNPSFAGKCVQSKLSANNDAANYKQINDLPIQATPVSGTDNISPALR